MRFIPKFNGVDFFPHDLRLPFMKYKGLAIGLSFVAMAISLALFFTKGLNYGVDFKGGSVVEVQSTTGPADVGSLREKLNSLGLGGVQLQQFGGPTDVLIRIEQQPGGEKEQQAALKKAQEALGSGYLQRRVEVVGPAVSSELRMTGFYAVLAALLTILGYSVNDTVVVSDRIRENLRKFKRMDLNELLNLSINETLSRTILTGCTAFVVLIALYIFGGEVIRNFNFAMLFGVVVGTYSSIFIAAPLLGYLGVKRDWSGEKAVASGPPAKARN